MELEKESSGSRYGSSLPVPSVQELAREPNLTLPSRYLRPDDHDLSVPDDHDLHQIPVIDFHKLISAESSTASDELEKLHLASKDWGFFQVPNTPTALCLRPFD